LQIQHAVKRRYMWMTWTIVTSSAVQSTEIIKALLKDYAGAGKADGVSLHPRIMHAPRNLI